MKQISPVAFCLLLAPIMVVTSCGIGENSDVNQLSNTPFRCHQYDVSFVDKKLIEVDPFIHNFSGSGLEILRNDIAGLPKSHIDFLVEANQKKNFTIQSATGLGGASGLTKSAGESRGQGWIWYPVRIDLLNSPQQIQYAAQHELGHALENKFRSHFRDREFQESFVNSLKLEANKHQNNPRMNNYPKSYLKHGNTEIYFKEFWAEAYNSFYCSPESADYLKDQSSPTDSFYSTYEWMSGFLNAPEWDSDATLKSEDIYVHSDTTLGVTLVSLPKAYDSLEFCLNSDADCQQSIRAEATGTTRAFYYLRDVLSSDFQIKISDTERFAVSLQK